MNAARLVWLSLLAAWALAFAGCRGARDEAPDERYRKLIHDVEQTLTAIDRKAGIHEIAMEDDTGRIPEGITVARGGLHLEGVVWNDDVPLAFVNGRVAGVGDRVGGFKVIAIDTEKVTFEDAEGQVRIENLYQE